MSGAPGTSQAQTRAELGLGPLLGARRCSDRRHLSRPRAVGRRLLSGLPASERAELVSQGARLREQLTSGRVLDFSDRIETPPDAALAHPVILVLDEPAAPNQHRDATLGQLRSELEQLRAAHPTAKIWVYCPAGEGRWTARDLPDGTAWLPTSVDLTLLFARTVALFCGSSALGLFALLHGVPVVTWDAPSYGNYGCTRQLGQKPPPAEHHGLSLDELVAQVFLLDTEYEHPLLQTPSSAECVVEHLALHRHYFAQNKGKILCFGFTLWKVPFVRRFLESPGNSIHFVRSLRGLKRHQLGPSDRVLLWSSRPAEEIVAYAREQGATILRMEDGFLRSVGLGSERTAPGSLVVDDSGIYYDPTTPSALERILASTVFTPEELTRARELRHTIVEARLSKYNPVADKPYRPGARAGQTVVLVPGQVADDASVRLGSRQTPSNEALLLSARRARPDAWLVYKPHPDVLSGNRKGRIEPGPDQPFDELVTDVPLPRCVEIADEIHTMSSLVGFEALLREKRVVVYGQPFYSGWGLTEDQFPLERRTRKLSLDELVAGTLLRYPRYYSWNANSFCTAEQLVAELKRNAGAANLDYKTPRVLRRLKGLVRLAREILSVR